MQIQVQEKRFSIMLNESLAELFGEVDSGVEGLARLDPFPVEVARSEGASIVSVDHAVWVQHWNYVYLKVVLQIFDQLLFRFIRV